MAPQPIYEYKYDLNKDEVIDDVDVALFMSVYGQLHSSSALAQACDFTGKGLVVDASDWSQFAPHYGAVASALDKWLPTLPFEFGLLNFLPLPRWLARQIFVV